MGRRRQSWNAYSNRSRGFTLIELLVVTSLIALLISMMLPSLARVREDARRTVCIANLKSTGIGLFGYATENRDLGPPVMEPMGRRAPRNLLSRDGALVNLGLLTQHAIDKPETFICPSQKQFNYSSNLEDLDTDTVSGSYAYAVQLPATASPRFAAIRHLAMVADDFVAAYGDYGIGKYSHRVGYNVLYTDGSATWYPDPDESVWRRKVYWDDESDDTNYQTLYDPGADVPEDEYGSKLNIFRVWHAFCYSTPDQYPVDASHY